MFRRTSFDNALQQMCDELKPQVRNSRIVGPYSWRSFLDLLAEAVDYRLQLWNSGKFEARIKRLEQYHCEHEFSNRGKGCLESVFCSKCGAVHPDWERDRDCDSSPGRVYVFKTPENMAVIDGRAYRKKKEEG